MILTSMDTSEIARVVKGMLEEVEDEYVGMGIMLLATKLCFPDVYDTDRGKALDWMINAIEGLT